MARRVDKVLLGQEGNPRQGRMTGHRTISLTATLAGALAIAITPVASANSLLSGYGGPGEGNQAILGSALVGGAGGSVGGTGGGGGSAGSTGDSTGSSPGSRAAAGGQAGRAQASPTGSGRGAAQAGRGARRSTDEADGSRAASGNASAGGARAYPVSSGSRTSAAAGGSVTNGLSGEDLGYVLLAFVVLGLIGVATRRLVQASPASRNASSG